MQGCEHGEREKGSDGSERRGERAAGGSGMTFFAYMRSVL
jgi:hypothetical protein